MLEYRINMQNPGESSQKVTDFNYLTLTGNVYTSELSNHNIHKVVHHTKTKDLIDPKDTKARRSGNIVIIILKNTL